MWNNCFNIHQQIFKYIMILISLASEKMLKMLLNDIMFLAMKATAVVYVGLYIHKFSTNVCKHSPNNCKIFHL